MKLQKHATLPTLLGALALSLTLAITGCGQSNADAEKEATTEEATTEETTEKAADTTEETTEDAAVPSDLAATTKATIDSIDPSAVASTEDFEAVPQEEDEEVGVSANELAESEDAEEVNRAQAGWTTWYEGGIHMDLPSDWKSQYDASSNQWGFESPNGKVACILSSIRKESGTTYDVEAITKSFIKSSEGEGFVDSKVLGYDTLYSEAYNTPCGGVLMYSNSSKGVAFLNLAEVIESKSYINIIYFLGEDKDFRTYVDTIDEALGTVEFKSGETV